MTPSATDASSKLIIGIDIGTRLSAVSYLLTRNGTPSGPIQHVKRWPGITATAQNQGGTTVPSLMYYGEDNRIKYGYDAEDEKHAAGYDSRRLVREFKRAVHRLGTNNVSVAAGSAFDQALQESDAGITLRDVYTDWLRFLMQQAKPQIEQRYSRSAGREWVTVWSERIVVLVIPNGWGIPEQATLRGALVDASFISVGTNARFVVESEVALYSAKGLKQFKPKKGEDFMVCDVGAATTDLALYTVLSENPLQVQEVKDHPSISIEAGLALAEEQTDEGNYVADDNDLGSFADDSVSPDDPSEAKDAALNKALDEQFSKIVQAIKGMIGQRQPKVLNPNHHLVFPTNITPFL
ncbi:hypothetical protein GLOTRDRAFT_140982 [Gloeophyllum trabeum ATCC 11539]|uniref:Actin-like ATPase domain-containing protein n=1 Tax=Gloeophyllum trabeum (strain ATCC 11539 / FP-39264 / Madison 617) TaxID=670483 RepID=S7RGD5_GLOTA|nr:uncharacterized protein GLOTRDRAFT_140982 [Gloeophyllum trabeum ATCC 11539]EPQ51594.1 hypothetical protein GLOTRDRAFT_140982 [Gloeophyllum trabeum ATCC 11539]